MKKPVNGMQGNKSKVYSADFSLGLLPFFWRFPRAHSLLAPVPGAFSKTHKVGDGGLPHFLLSWRNPTHLPVAISR